MAATPASFCPQCGTPLPDNPRFCTNCGATIEIHASSPTIAASQTPLTPPAGGVPSVPPGPANVLPTTVAPPPPPNTLTGGSIYTNMDEGSLPPPPPPSLYNPYTHSMPGGMQNYAQPTLPNTYTPPPVVNPPLQAGAYQVPAYAKKQKGGRGCVTASIVLILIVALGIGGYILTTSLINRGNRSNNASTTNTPTTGNTTSQGTTPTATTATNAASSTPLNLQFTYASVNITIVSAQIAQSFSDDPNTTAGSAGIVRVNLRENNPTSHNPNYLEGDAMLLLLPDGNTVQASNEHTGISPDSGVNRQNWLDFPLNSQVTLAQLILRVGTQSQSQFEIPLQAKADISKYQDKTSSPGTKFTYGGLNMTLKTATLSYSYVDQQASTGNRYVILTLAAVNATANNVDIYPSSYIRLQAGGNTTEPDNNYTLPYNVSGNTSASGIVAFLVPQDATSFTLVLLAQTSASPAISQVTQTFQVP